MNAYRVEWQYGPKVDNQRGVVHANAANSTEAEAWARGYLRRMIHDCNPRKLRVIAISPVGHMQAWQRQQRECAALEAAKRVSPFNFTPVLFSGQPPLKASRFWSRHSGWVLARWDADYLALTHGGHLYLVQNGKARQVTASHATLEKLFAPHKAVAWWTVR